MTDFPTARAKIGGLKGVMTALGDAPANGRWGSMAKCPFCERKDHAGVFTREGVDFFKCFHNTCSSGGVVMSEIGYIAARCGLSDAKPAEGGASQAYRKFLELAGCWEEPAPRPATKDVGSHSNGNVNPERVPAGSHTTQEAAPSTEEGGVAPSESTSAAPLPPW